jgi:tetratricopeptide (TPR) repeat protein
MLRESHRKDYVEKVAPKLVAGLGGLGLGSALAYFVGVYLAFQPDWGAWSAFFVPRALPLVLIPYLSLTAYLYMRSRLGGWLVDRGAYDRAISYAGERLDASLLRSKKETHLHRIALGRAHVAKSEYEEAYRVLSKGYAVPKEGAQALEIHRWRIEAALRLEDLVRCHESYDNVAGAARPAASRVYVLGCRIEIAVREKNRAECNRFVEEFEWTELECTRVDLARALELIAFEEDDESLERALGLLEDAHEDAVADVPGRHRGLLAWRARALASLGRLEEAEITLKEAAEAPGDGRSDYVVEQTKMYLESVSQH